MPEIGKSKYAGIQQLRAIAVMLVLAYHLSLTPALLGLLPVRPSSPFWVGVELFFVISGLVVTKALFRDGRLIPFFVRRILRLWPALIFFFLLSAGTLWAVKSFASP